MNYVSQESFQLARTMEQKIASLPSASGILFVGITPEPVENGISSTYTVRVGMSRLFETGAVHAIVSQILTPEISVGVDLRIEVYKGIAARG